MGVRLIILYISFSFFLQAQVIASNKIDSLVTVLNNTKADSVKLDILLGLAWEGRRVDPDQSLDYCFKALQIANDYNDYNQAMRSTNLIGTILRYAGSYEEAIRYFSTVETLAVKYKNKQEEGFANVNMGYTYQLQGNFEFAEKRLLQGAEIAEKHDILIVKDYAYTYLTMLYYKMENYNEALVFGEKAEIAVKARSENIRLGILYQHIGNIYYKMKAYETSITNLNKSILNLNSEVISANRSRLVIANIYFELKKYSLSLDYTIKSITEITAIKTTGFEEIDRLNLYLDLGKVLTSIYRLRGDFEILSKYQDSMLMIMDKIANDKSAQEVLNENVLLRLATKENEYLKLELRNNEQKRIMERRRTYEVVAILFFIFLIFFINYKRRKLQSLNQILEIQKKELKALNATKEKFFSLVAHDLKNPFSALLGLVDIMKEDLKTGLYDQTETLLNYISETVNAGYRLLDNLLSWSQNQRGEITYNPIKTNLKNLINQSLNLMSSNAQEKQIQFKLNIAEQQNVYVDENMINTVIRNLLSNAIKFSHKNSIIEINALKVSDYLKVSIIDTGMGIPERTRSKLFEINENISTHGTFGEKGTGIGLPLCKEFIEVHGGKIGVNSEEGKGSEFWFIIKSI